MSPKLHEFTVYLERRTRDTPWGIRLCGGVDLNAPLIITKVTPGSCSQPELMRGDIITKIEDYDARDLRHEDAQMLFKNASNQIKIAVRRDDNIALKQCLNHNESSRCSSAMSQEHSSYPPELENQPQRITPIPKGPEGWTAALQNPISTLPHTEFPHAAISWDPNDPTHTISTGGNSTCVFPPPPPPRVFSPRLTRDYQYDNEDDVAISNQPYRTTPLILPGAKVKKDYLPTQSYLRHHPNPAMRAGPQHDFNDVLMKQKLADTVLQRVVGEEASSGKVVHKQFNSPIGLYSQNNIENTIKSTVPSSGVPQAAPNTQQYSVPLNNGTRPNPTKIQGYKKTVVFDPLKSDTYKFLQEQEDCSNIYQPPELQSNTAQHKVFQPNRLVPGKKPTSSFPPPQPDYMKHVNSMGESGELIQQSHSFKRLMHHVLGETEY